MITLQTARPALAILVTVALVGIATAEPSGPGAKANPTQSSVSVAPAAAVQPITEKHRTYLQVEAKKYGCDLEAIRTYTLAKKLPWNKLATFCIPGGRWFVGLNGSERTKGSMPGTEKIVARFPANGRTDRDDDVILTVAVDPLYGRITAEPKIEQQERQQDKQLELLLQPSSGSPTLNPSNFDGYLPYRVAKLSSLMQPQFVVNTFQVGRRITHFSYYLNDRTHAFVRLHVRCSELIVFNCALPLESGPELFRVYQQKVDELLGYDIKVLQKRP